MAGLFPDWLVKPFRPREATLPGNVRHPPGQAHGLLDMLRGFGGWVGAKLSRNTGAGEHVTSEKVAGGPRGVVLPAFLPYFDDQTGETPAMRTAYRQMLADPNIKAALLTKVLGVAALDLQITPADKKNEKDREVADFVHWMLTERVQDCVPGLVWAVLSGGLIDGYSVCEKVWHVEERGRYRDKVVLTALKAKDTTRDLVLLTDEYRNVVGLRGLRFNSGEIFHPSDFVIYTHLGLFGRPTGQSDLRAVYSRYWMLDTVWKLRAICLEKRSMPILVGSYKESKVSKQPALERALALAKSQHWISLPEECKVEALSIAGSAEQDFKSAVADLKHDIFLGIQGAILQNLEGETTDGRGDTQVHKSTSDLFRWHLSAAVASLLNDRDSGLIKDIVDLNFVVEEYPKASLSAVDVNEMKLELEIDQGLHQMGLDLDKDEIYERYNRTPPKDAANKLAGQQGAPPGGAPGGLPFTDSAGPRATVSAFTPGKPDEKPAPEVAGATPFRGFSESWRQYLNS